MLKIIDNSNVEERDIAEEALKNMQLKYGKRYCPCAVVQSPDTICPCKNFREQNIEGVCHCGRYMKVLDHNANLSP